MCWQRGICKATAAPKSMQTSGGHRTSADGCPRNPWEDAKSSHLPLSGAWRRVPAHGRMRQAGAAERLFDPQIVP
jgi:hypothetical protein